MLASRMTAEDEEAVQAELDALSLAQAQAQSDAEPEGPVAAGEVSNLPSFLGHTISLLLLSISSLRNVLSNRAQKLQTTCPPYRPSSLSRPTKSKGQSGPRHNERRRTGLGNRCSPELCSFEQICRYCRHYRSFRCHCCIVLLHAQGSCCCFLPDPCEDARRREAGVRIGYGPWVER